VFLFEVLSYSATIEQINSKPDNGKPHNSFEKKKKESDYTDSLQPKFKFGRYGLHAGEDTL